MRHLIRRRRCTRARQRTRAPPPPSLVMLLRPSRVVRWSSRARSRRRSAPRTRPRDIRVKDGTSRLRLHRRGRAHGAQGHRRTALPEKRGWMDGSWMEGARAGVRACGLDQKETQKWRPQRSGCLPGAPWASSPHNAPRRQRPGRSAPVPTGSPRDARRTLRARCSPPASSPPLPLHVADTCPVHVEGDGRTQSSTSSSLVQLCSGSWRPGARRPCCSSLARLLLWGASTRRC